MFGNLKAELWWLARVAFQRTYQHVLHLEGKTEEDGARKHPLSDLIAPCRAATGERHAGLAAQPGPLLPNEKGKIVIEKKAELQRRGIKSPDHADAFVLTFDDRGNQREDVKMMTELTP
jgi:phage terminase large subunit